MVLKALFWFYETMDIDNEDDDDADDKLFLWYGWSAKDISPYFKPGPFSEIKNFQHAVSRVWTCTEPEFRLSLMNLRSNNNH